MVNNAKNSVKFRSRSVGCINPSDWLNVNFKYETQGYRAPTQGY